MLMHGLHQSPDFSEVTPLNWEQLIISEVLGNDSTLSWGRLGRVFRFWWLRYALLDLWMLRLGVLNP